MRYLLLPFTPRYILFTIAILATFALGAIGLRHPNALPALALPLAVFGALVLLGICDLMQTRHAILHNYPIAAHIRFILEHIRPELRQYFFEARRTAHPSRATSAPSSISALLVAAAVVVTAPLQYVPMAALGAVLIAAALSLIDLESLRLFYRIDPPRPFSPCLPLSASSPSARLTPFCLLWRWRCCASSD
jgi:hypothetical protein